MKLKYHKQYKVTVGYKACGSALLALARLVCIQLNPPGLICRSLLSWSLHGTLILSLT